jgi:Flp pilus assembly protein CpaB
VKQKNVILMVVAVACGLAAAVLTTQMTGKPAAPDQVEILVAAKELPVGTKLAKDKLAALVKKKKVNKADVPPEGAFFKEEELADKFVQRPRGQEDVIFATDVGPKPPGLSPPEGKLLVTMKLPYEHVGPFIEPGSKVDVECAVQTGEMKKLRQFALLTEVQVLAVDTIYATGPQDPKGGRPQINTVTVALTPNEARWYQIATKLGADIRLLVRGEKSPKIPRHTDEELTKLFFEPDSGNSVPSADGSKPKGKTIKVWVPKTFLAAGTAITEDAISDKFKEKEIDETDAPKDAVTDLSEFLGKYLSKNVEQGDALGKDAFGDKPAELSKPPVKPAVEPLKVEKAPKPRKVVRKPIAVWEPEIVSPKGTEKHRYEKYDEKEGWLYRGIVGRDGTVTPAPAPEKTPDAPKDDKGGKVS